MNYIKLDLSGVLQYFSDTNTTTIKTTYNSSLYPTKSAIVGLLSSALGYNRNDNRITELFNILDIKYKVIKNPIVLKDFQTITGLKHQNNYMNLFYNRNVVTTMSNNTRNMRLTKSIQYLQDAEFIVYVGCNDSKLKEIYDAIKNPVYSLYIGKRSCIPNKPLVTTFKLIREEELLNVYDCA